MKLASLKPDTRNANKGTARGRELVRESLKRYGAGRSILIDKSGNVIAGNKTLEGAKAVGLENVQIVKSDGTRLVAVQRTDLDINDKAARELAIADNRASELGLEWDTDVLKALEEEVEIDLAPFWDERELVQFWADRNGEAPEPKLDQAAELQQKWKTELGQLWLIGRHRLLCGDAADFKTFNAEISACITDPPYGIAHNLDYTRFTGGVADTRNRTKGVLQGDNKPFDPKPFLDFESVVLWGANCFSDRLPLGTWLVWDKRFGNGTAFLSDAEVAWMKGGHGVYLQSVTSQGFVRPEPVAHPTQKPVSVICWCMEKSKAGEIVLDPFCGSGTTIIACEQTKRICYALEIEPKYVAVALQRMVDMGLKPELAS
jgi:site-specific DNA-methyltransferase (adenine-specific)